MKSFANDPSLDRVLLISREEMGGAAGGFDPLHPVYTQTEGADPFTYRNDFCHMRLLADGTVELTESGRPARFAEEWRRLLSQLAACRTLTDLRIYDYDGDEPPMAAALTTYGRLLLYGNAGEYAPAAGWQGVARVFWDTDGFGALCEDEMFRAVGALSALDGIGEIEEAVGSALPGHCSPVAYLLQKNGTVTLFDRKNKSIQRPRERVQKIALVRYNPYGVSTWVALSKITGRFLCSEPRDSISADFFGGDYTDIIAPNRFRQKIADFAAVPRRYLAVLYQNGYLRVFGSGYHSGDILCEDVRGIELEGEELIAYLLQKNGTVTLFDRKNKSIQRPRERVQKIALVRYNPYGVSTWVALSKITGRFLCSEPRDSISADFFGGDYTDIIAPNRFRQKIADFAAVPRRYLAVLYQNGYLRVFGSGYHSGDILCEDVRGIELEGEELIAYLPADLSYAPAIDLEEPEEGDTLSPAESIVTLGQPVDLPAILSLLRQRVEGWRRAEELAPPAAKKPVRAIRRSERYIYFLYRDGTVEAALLTHTGHSPHGENAVSHWKNVREVIPGRHQTLALCEDGSVLAAGRGYGQPYAVSAWKNVTQLYQSSGLAAAVTAAGTVYAQWADTNEPVQGTEQWRHITQLALGDDFILGLTTAGRVLAAGTNEEVTAGVKNWANITQIAAVSEAAAALTGAGTVLSCGHPRFLQYQGMEEWRHIRQLIAFQNGGSVFVGLDDEGQVHFSGKWSHGALCRTDSVAPEKWSGLRRIWQEGYYLLGEKRDGSVIWESTPTERAGLPPADDHITDWTEVTDWVIEGEYLMAIFRDGSIGWEGARRRPEKRRITEGWRNIRRCLLWSIAGGRSNAMAVDAAGRLFSDQSGPEGEFFRQFTGVRRMAVFQPFLLVLHGEILSFVLFGKNGFERHDLPQVEHLLTAEEGKTVVVTFTDGRVRSFGQTLYDSTVDPAAKAVRFYGDRSDYLENDTDPFRHFEGVIGLQGAGTPFVLSAHNSKVSENFYSVQQLMYFAGIRYAAAVEPLGDLLLADGTCRSRRGDLFAKWVGIMQLSSCPTHTVGVTTFHTAVVYGDGEYGSCSVDAYMGIVQAFALPHATVLRQADGTLISLCEKLSETPYEPLPVTSGVTMMAKTGSHFALLCRDGSLWCCEAQAFADKIRWRGSSEYYTRPWGPWQKLFTDATRMTVTGEEIRIWRHDTHYSYMEPTLEQNTLSGQEPTIIQ